MCRRSERLFGSCRCLGTRAFNADGTRGAYQYRTYKEIATLTRYFGSGLKNLGAKRVRDNLFLSPSCAAQSVTNQRLRSIGRACRHLQQEQRRMGHHGPGVQRLLPGHHRSIRHSGRECCCLHRRPCWHPLRCRIARELASGAYLPLQFLLTTYLWRLTLFLWHSFSEQHLTAPS